MISEEIKNDHSTIRIFTASHTFNTRRIYGYEIIWDESLPHPGAIDQESRIYLNPNMISNIGELAVIFGHEIGHELLDHVVRRNNFLGISDRGSLENISQTDIVLWNLASDHIVNKLLKAVLKYEFISKYNLNDFLNKMVDLSRQYGSDVDEMCVEVLFRFLKENTEVSITEQTVCMPGGSGSQQNQQNQSGSGNQRSDQKQNQSKSGTVQDSKENEGSGDNSDNKQNQKQNQGNQNQQGQGSGNQQQFKVITSEIRDKKTGEVLYRDYKVVIDLCSHPNKEQGGKAQKRQPRAHGIPELMDSLKKAIGDVPGTLKHEFDFIKHPLDLSRELQQYFTIVRNGMDDVTFLKADPLSYVLNMDVALPSYVSRKAKVTIGIDTSGSISNEEYKNFISIIKRNFQYITGKIYLCDCEITDEIDISSTVDSIVESALNRLKQRSGYGGTEFLPVFEKAKKENPDVVIYFTDLFAHFPELGRKFKVLWVVKKTHETMSVRVPYGKVVWF